MNARLNSELLEELKELMEDEFSVLLDTYLKESERQFNCARTAWEDEDLESLKRFAHSLKGSSSNIGAAQLSVLCAKLESSAKNGERATLPDLLACVAEELGAVRTEVQTMRAQL